MPPPTAPAERRLSIISSHADGGPAARPTRCSAAGADSDGDAPPGLEGAPAGTTRNSEHVKVYMFVRRDRSRISHALFCRYWEEIHM